MNGRDDCGLELQYGGPNISRLVSAFPCTISELLRAEIFILNRKLGI
jgi:hypothetical protein